MALSNFFLVSTIFVPIINILKIMFCILRIYFFIFYDKMPIIKKESLLTARDAKFIKVG